MGDWAYQLSWMVVVVVVRQRHLVRRLVLRGFWFGAPKIQLGKGWQVVARMSERGGFNLEYSFISIF